MSIPDTFHFDKEGEVVRYPKLRPYFLTAVIILVALLSFGVGRLTGQDREGVTINYNPESLVSQSGPKSSVVGEVQTSVTASSQGTRYYFSHCGNNISDKNRVTFASAVLAEKAGYTLAVNCKVK